MNNKNPIRLEKYLENMLHARDDAEAYFYKMKPGDSCLLCHARAKFEEAQDSIKSIMMELNKSGELGYRVEWITSDSSGPALSEVNHQPVEFSEFLDAVEYAIINNRDSMDRDIYFNVVAYVVEKEKP